MTIPWLTQWRQADPGNPPWHPKPHVWQHETKLSDESRTFTLPFECMQCLSDMASTAPNAWKIQCSSKLNAVNPCFSGSYIRMQICLHWQGLAVLGYAMETPGDCGHSASFSFMRFPISMNENLHFSPQLSSPSNCRRLLDLGFPQLSDSSAIVYGRRTPSAESWLACCWETVSLGANACSHSHGRPSDPLGIRRTCLCGSFYPPKTDNR